MNMEVTFNKAARRLVLSVPKTDQPALVKLAADLRKRDGACEVRNRGATIELHVPLVAVRAVLAMDQFVKDVKAPVA